MQFGTGVDLGAGSKLDSAPSPLPQIRKSASASVIRKQLRRTPAPNVRGRPNLRIGEVPGNRQLRLEGAPCPFHVFPDRHFLEERGLHATTYRKQCLIHHIVVLRCGAFWTFA